MSAYSDITAEKGGQQERFSAVIYYIEGKIADEKDWVRGLTKFSSKERADAHREIVQRAFDEHCRWKMETRVVETDGNIL
jgi:hypothetical protein